ncbi:DUF2917 domain-containing protein [Ideonella sp. BN130291]|uniref:DUF2917 domain-containing protein n=1 Tax=Ideonella sp. BN130291 TaxID=3112940 RepID=UPI002E25B421|nr:DUF2917 domain-containing protein [Ideonella sp. BN130291]
MTTTAQPTLLQLREGQHLRCNDEHPVRLSVLQGRVWLTRAGDPDDHFLVAGQSMALAAGAQAVLSAEGGPAEVRLLQQEPGRTMQALQPALCDPS